MAILCAMMTGSAMSQQLAFPRAALKDSSLLAKAIPALATAALQTLEDNDNHSPYLINRFVLQVAAEKYVAALHSIEAYRRYYAATDPDMAGIRFIQYQTWCETKLLQAKCGRPFKYCFKSSFSNTFSQLSHGNNFDIDSWFLVDTTALHTDLKRTLVLPLATDSISVSDAISLCKKYTAWRIHTTMVPLAVPLLATINQSHYRINDSLLVPTRDGTQISVIVARPAKQSGPLPVIFFFTIYTETKNLNIAKEAAAKGYIGVVANTRGKRHSPQEPVPYEHDGNDAYDVIDWISRQSWCNGRIGMYGGSYVGFTQWAAVKNGVHPALKTIVPSAAVVPGFDVPKENNIFMNFVYSWIPYVTNNKFLDNETYDDRQRWQQLNFNWYNSGAAYSSMDSIDGIPDKIFHRWLQHPAYDTYWQNMTAYRNDFSHINIPILSTTGYFDGAQIGAMYYFREHLKYNPHATHYFVIGPYDHLGCQHVSSPYVSGMKIDSVANLSIHRLIYEWFDYILKDGRKPALLKDKINYEVIGDNQWKHVPTLGGMNNDTLTFYLDSSKLSSIRPVISRQMDIQVDLTERSNNATINAILSPLMDTTVNSINGLRFESSPLKEDLTINGSFLGQLQAIINKKDMDIGVNLYELTSDGQYFQLSYFVGRASYAHGLEERQLLIPGSISSIPFSNTRMISKRIRKGSRFVAILNINKSPFEQINYGTGGDVSQESVAGADTPLHVRWLNSSYIAIPVNR